MGANYPLLIFFVMKTRYTLLTFWFVLCSNVLIAQHLQPGFDKAEYIEMMKISARFGAPDYVAAIPAPNHYKFVYRSPIVSLDNTWDLWTHNQRGNYHGTQSGRSYRFFADGLSI